MYPYNNNMTHNTSYDPYNSGSDYSDGESVIESLLGNLSPCPSMETYSPAPSDVSSDHDQGFSCIFTGMIPSQISIQCFMLVWEFSFKCDVHKI